MKQLAVATLSLVVALAGCGQGSSPTTTSPTKPAAGAPAAAHADAQHDDKHDDDHDHGPVSQLGTQTIGGFSVKASADGAIAAGKDVPVDASITAPQGAPTIASVRFWIGARDGKGSVKAKGDANKDNYHAHVDVPSPLAADSKLWVEIETDKHEKHVGGFDLKPAT